MGRGVSITDVELFGFSPEMRQSGSAPDRGVKSSSRILVRLEAGRDRDGWGDCALSWRTEELTDRAAALRSVLVGRNLYSIEEMLRLDALAEAPLRCAVETACWDLIGRVCREPLAHLWGGFYRRRLPPAIRLRGSTPTEEVLSAREQMAQGFHSFVIEATGRPEEDLRTMAMVRGQVGRQTELRLDGRQQYDLETAAEMCRQLAPYQLQCFIDPLVEASPEAWKALARGNPVPLAVSRSIRSVADLVQLAKIDAIDYAGITLERVGGPTAARQCAVLAEAAGMRPFLMTGLSPGPTAAVMVQLAASTPALDCCNETGYTALYDDLLVEPIASAGGMVMVPQGIGLGVEIDPKKLERL